MEFEWDSLKAGKNLRKHGVSFHEGIMKKVNDSDRNQDGMKWETHRMRDS